MSWSNWNGPRISRSGWRVSCAPSVHYFKRRYRFVGDLRRGPFKSLATQTEGYLLCCGRYIEATPWRPGW